MISLEKFLPTGNSAGTFQRLLRARSNAATCQAFRCGVGGCGCGIGAALVTRRSEGG